MLNVHYLKDKQAILKFNKLGNGSKLHEDKIARGE